MDSGAKADPRNARLAVFNGALMIGTSNSVASPELVLTAFAAFLTSNPLILGLVAPLQGAMSSLPQFWMVSRVQRAQHALPLYNYAALIRAAGWIVLTVAALLLRDKTILLIVLLSFSLLGGLATGVAGLPFIEVVGKIVPPRQRGVIFGWRGALGGVAAVIGSQVVLLFTGPDSRYDFPTNYGLLFAFAGLTQMIGYFSFSLVKEPDTDAAIQHAKPSFKLIREIWRTDDNYRHFVGGYTYFTLGSMANGLIIVYANQALGVRLELAGLYLLVASVLRPIFSAAAGRVSVRVGNRLPVSFGVLAQAVGWALLVMAAPLGVEGRAAEYYLLPIYSLTAIQKGLVFSNLMALGLNVTPPDERALYMGALNTWLGIVTFTGVLSGALAEAIGFQALFGVMLVLSALSVWQFMALQEHWEDEGHPASP